MRLDARVLARQAEASEREELRQAEERGEHARGWGMGSSSWQDIIFAPNESQQFRISHSLSLSLSSLAEGVSVCRLRFLLFCRFCFWHFEFVEHPVCPAPAPFLTLLVVLLPFKPINELKIFYANECECF